MFINIDIFDVEVIAEFKFVNFDNINLIAIFFTIKANKNKIQKK